jgi:hypothetical protein
VENVLLGIYCERTGPGLLAEPLNALSNGSFLIAAGAAWALARRSGGLSAGLWVLLALVASVGIGSGVWHTLATPWAMILDVVPIALFLVWTLWLYARTVLRMSLPLALASMAAFLGISASAQGFEEILNGSIAYAPALIVLLGLGAYHARQATAGRYALLLAASAYAIALVFRVLDPAVCSAFPIGTHFLWHSFTGLAAYLAMRSLILSRGASMTAHGSDLSIASDGQSEFRAA